MCVPWGGKRRGALPVGAFLPVCSTMYVLLLLLLLFLYCLIIWQAITSCFLCEVILLTLNMEVVLLGCCFWIVVHLHALACYSVLVLKST